MSLLLPLTLTTELELYTTYGPTERAASVID